MKKQFFIAAACFTQIHAQAQTPTWSANVAPILYNKCATCHHNGGIAPFSLLHYSDAVANAASMKSDVQSHKMPPWPPDPNYSHLAHERVLSAAEIATITNWVDVGTPSGDTTLAPPAPTFSNHALSGTPDLIIKIPPYTSTASTSDVYQCFAIPSGLLTDKYIAAFEAVPGNSGIVHHVLVYSDTTGACASLDAASPGPGYPDFGGVGSNNAVLLGGWVPGTQPMQYPSGFGVKLAHNADVVLQIHYPAGSAGQLDTTEVHFYFSSASSVRNVTIDPVLYHGSPVINAPLYIPANATRTFNEHAPIPFDASLLNVAPHMHLLGQWIKSYAVHPAGDTDKLISIPKWDFHWQGFYAFPRIRKIPAGSVLWAEAFYDNTTANPENPHNPPQNVSLGESTTDEMMLVFFAYTPYQAGDESVIIDSGLLSVPPVYYHGQQLLDVCPNPAANDLIVKCYMEKSDVASIDLIDMQGRSIKQLMKNEQLNAGYSALSYSVSSLPAGAYILRMRTSERVLTQKLEIRH